MGIEDCAFPVEAQQQPPHTSGPRDAWGNQGGNAVSIPAVSGGFSQPRFRSATRNPAPQPEPGPFRIPVAVLAKPGSRAGFCLN
jgi:hypothetical protein